MPDSRGDVVHNCLGNHPRSGSRLSSRLFLVEKIAVAWRPVIDLSHPNRFFLQSPFMIETVASVLLSIREGDFLASVNLSDACFLIPGLQDSRKLLVVPVGWGSLPVRGPVLWTVDCPSGLHQCVFCRSLCLGSVPRDSASQVPTR